MAASGPVWAAAGEAPPDLGGYERIDFASLRERHIDAAHTLSRLEPTASGPAGDWLAWLREPGRRIAVTDVPTDPDALDDLLGYVVDPAWRAGTGLVVVADRRLDTLDGSEHVDGRLGIALTVERLRHRFDRPPAGPLRRRRPTPATGFRGDRDQSRAISAGGGVVQVLAPPGAGKTTVLVERCCELRRAGVPARRICCLTFSRAAAAELRDRLASADAGPVRTTTFHGLAWQILRRADDARWPDPCGADRIDSEQWAAIVRRARRDVGAEAVDLSVSDIRTAISAVKRELLRSAQEYEGDVVAVGDARARTVARLYVRYEQTMRRNARACRRDLCDHDDLLLGALRALAADPRLRRFWQRRARHMLVDEYQDIDHAQEQLMRVLAAPDDDLFCVADEDQALYGFRGASVQRTIALDRLYPGLQRIVLATSYRCPPAVVDAARRLIDCNVVRFPKPLRGVGDGAGEAIAVHAHVGVHAEAAAVARRLAAGRRGEVVVLARTWNQLRALAAACAEDGVAVDGPARLFEPAPARLALRAHLRLATAPHQADAGAVRAVCAYPPRELAGSPGPIAAALRRGVGLAEALAATGERPGAQALGVLLDRVAVEQDAGRCVALLAGDGGLRDWLAELERDEPDGAETDMLDACAAEAAGLAPVAYLDRLERQVRRIATARAAGEGIELATIHQAKGRQWPAVVVIGANDGRLPHRLAVQDADDSQRRGDGVEAERRLFYVALTRAERTAEVHYDRSCPSPFLAEAGLLVDPSPTTGTRKRDLARST